MLDGIEHINNISAQYNRFHDSGSCENQENLEKVGRYPILRPQGVPVSTYMAQVNTHTHVKLREFSENEESQVQRFQNSIDIWEK